MILISTLILGGKYVNNNNIEVMCGQNNIKCLNFKSWSELDVDWNAIMVCLIKAHSTAGMTNDHANG